jgi:hypothetical protein
VAEPEDPESPAAEKSERSDRNPLALDRLADIVARQVTDPVWQRINDGESRWPVSVVVAAAIAIQLALPRGGSSRSSKAPSPLG